MHSWKLSSKPKSKKNICKTLMTRSRAQPSILAWITYYKKETRKYACPFARVVEGWKDNVIDRRKHSKCPCEGVHVALNWTSDWTFCHRLDKQTDDRLYVCAHAFVNAPTERSVYCKSYKQTVGHPCECVHVLASSKTWWNFCGKIYRQKGEDRCACVHVFVVWSVRRTVSGRRCN